MFLSWQNNLAIPFFAVSLAIFPRVEAFASSKLAVPSLNSSAQSTSRIFDRQASNLDSLSKKSTPLTKSLTKILLAQSSEIDRLQDIKPTDWSYAALKNLIERYGCITGFPDRTFRGEQSVTRAEFAAGLNNCLDTIESLMNNPDTLSQADVDVVLKLMQEFQSDLAILQGKTDGIQARTEDLEASQFSATSKLKGEAVFGLGSILEGEGETVFGSRSRINLQTSFRGDDQLLTRLTNQNFSGFAESTETFQGELAFGDPQDGFELEVLQYNFGVGDNLDFILGATGIEANDITDTINALDGDGGSGSISIFGTRNPIYNVSRDAGLGGGASSKRSPRTQCGLSGFDC